MSMSMTAIREFCKMFVQTDQAPKTRIVSCQALSMDVASNRCSTCLMCVAGQVASPRGANCEDELLFLSFWSNLCLWSGFNIFLLTKTFGNLAFLYSTDEFKEDHFLDLRSIQSASNSSSKTFMEDVQFFPDKKESVLARGGTFEGTPFKIDFLTSPSGLSDIGWEKKVKMTDRVQPSDEASRPESSTQGTGSFYKHK